MVENLWLPSPRPVATKRQSVACIGVVRRIRAQVLARQIAVESCPDAVNDSRIRLQTHALVQPSREHARNSRTFSRQRRLLLDDRGKDERLIGRIDRRLATALPFLVEHLLH